MDYQQFLDGKEITVRGAGFAVQPETLPVALMTWQRKVVTWALMRGRAALFEDCGLGKTLQQLAWADAVCKHTGGAVLILAPLGVVQQTVAEADRFGMTAKYCISQKDVDPRGINITNYEKLHHFPDTAMFQGVVLDESSILKSSTSATRAAILGAFRNTAYRLACTATPAPNDYTEFGGHADFLGVMSQSEMLATFFKHDGGDTSKWELKGHAKTKFWQWLAGWAVFLRSPADLGYDALAYQLSPLIIDHHVAESAPPEGMLLATEAQTLAERRKARRSSLSDRVQQCADLVNSTPGSWVVWCGLNDEGDSLEKAIPDAVQVAGRHSDEYKEQAMLDFASGKKRVMITKPSICGFGLNWQHCANEAFVGVSDSWEDWYQAVRRCWRFGQKNAVSVHVFSSEAEGAVVANLQRKEADAARMADAMINEMRGFMEVATGATIRQSDNYRTDRAEGENWTMILGDCVEKMRDVPSDSVDYSVFSPPFASLYTYSNSPRDMGNARTYSEFAEHYRFLVAEQFRTLRPGRLLSFHCMLIPTTKQHHGYIGLQDFRGDLIRMYQDAGFIFHSEVVIWKDPVTAMQRTKAIGLLYKQLKKDSALSRQGIPDYLITMRKPGTNTAPITKDPEQFGVDLWQRYASPVWMDINPSDTLQRESAREDQDERHICPLQLEVIERGIQLWSNPGDLVLSPFGGIGSEGYVAVGMGRRYLGIELKPSYYQQSVANLREAERQRHQPTMFDLIDNQETCEVD